MRGHELPVPERIDAPQHAVRGVPEPLRNLQLRRADLKFMVTIRLVHLDIHKVKLK